jgi:hypothetical protein
MESSKGQAAAAPLMNFPSQFWESAAILDG